jgi:hypothetical protein
MSDPTKSLDVESLWPAVAGGHRIPNPEVRQGQLPKDVYGPRM